MLLRSQSTGKGICSMLKTLLLPFKTPPCQAELWVKLRTIRQRPSLETLTRRQSTDICHTERRLVGQEESRLDWGTELGCR